MIDCFRQLLGASPFLACVHDVRERLCGQFAARNVAHVGESTYLTLDMHWDATVRYLAEVTGADVRPEDLTVVCVCREYQEGQHHHGMVDGNGPRVVSVLNQGNSHFVPLFPEG